MPERPDKSQDIVPWPRRRLTVQQAVFLLVLTAHGSVWLGIMIIAPSLQAVLIMLSSYLAVLATLGLLLSARDAARGPDDDSTR
nr:hypothetical protein [Streptomyces chartreusis]